MIDQLRHRRVPLIGDGGGWWSFVHIEDAAAATVAAMQHGKAAISTTSSTMNPRRSATGCPRLPACSAPSRHFTCRRGSAVAGRRACGFDDDAGAGSVQRKGQTRTWLAAGASILAGWICGNRRAVGRQDRSLKRAQASLRRADDDAGDYERPVSREDAFADSASSHASASGHSSVLRKRNGGAVVGGGPRGGWKLKEAS